MQVAMKRFQKRTVIILFAAAMALLAAVVLIYHNPLADQRDEMLKKGIACALIVGAVVCFAAFYDKITVLPHELYQNRRLIFKLAKNDFRKRYAGSYMGAFWAMAQPVITVAMYYFVFTVLLPNKQRLLSGGATDVPFVLFLTAGLVPWFYFSEAITSATGALLEYNYLVKKVVFKISVLPIIKIIAATYIHAFFVVVLLVIACIYGYYPSLYTLQVFYYSACMFILVLALSYTTCSIVVFFRDLSQIINIGLQVGMWATPVLWNLNEFGDKVQMFVKINPLVYIVEGYRSAVYGHQWFWEDFYSTVYFWIITLVLFGIGALIFKKLKIHFADIL